MSTIITGAEKFDMIKQEVLEAWQKGHGWSSDEIHIFQGQDGFVIMIPKALYQAELELYSNSPGGGRVLNQYIRTILDIIASDFVPKVENIIGVEVKEVIPLIDLDAGWAVAFFKTQ